MGIITAILSAVGAVFTVVVNIIGGIAKALPWWVWLIPLGMILGIYMMSGAKGCNCRDMGCSCRRPRDPKPPKWDDFTVARATTGASLECSTGRKDRRTRTVVLANIAAPVDGPMAEESRANLERIAGKTVRVERHGLFSSDASTSQVQLHSQAAADYVAWIQGHRQLYPDCVGPEKCSDAWARLQVVPEDERSLLVIQDGQRRLEEEPPATAEAPEAPKGTEIPCSACKGTGKCKPPAEWIKEHPEDDREFQCWACGGDGGLIKYTQEEIRAYQAAKQAYEARGPIVGVVYGESGACLNLEQIMSGMAKCLPAADKTWLKQEAIAKKKKLGVWK